MASVNWKKDQIELVLSCVLQRIRKEPQNVTIKRESKEVSIDNIRHSVVNKVPQFNVCIYDKKRVWLSFGGESSGSYQVNNSWPFYADKTLVELIEKVLESTTQSQDASAVALHNCFPEAVSKEFEKVVLDGKEE